jgi:hypothetical protein
MADALQSDSNPIERSAGDQRAMPTIDKVRFVFIVVLISFRKLGATMFRVYTTTTVIEPLSGMATLKGSKGLVAAVQTCHAQMALRR